ncbi:hypothetical protein GCM10027084_05310 [Pseudoxanthomonas sangjuensis]|uniref:hypothetical protein n=1 Tax=Pseudoxanthomonas sangjuensis TaxID=1503750 RepID=UPI00139162A4|nr:hypothetical protein [Pseudoxanthomonas sangjuensis]KAF1705859.1 hypothetical protein CSC71_14865 [Pseudoxanthomonas sangjuensis]
MPKIIVSVWIYLCGVVGAVVTGSLLSQVLSVFPPSQMEAYGPVVPAVARSWSVFLPSAPAILWCSAAASALLGLYLWRSRGSLETRLFSAAVIAAVNLFLSMFFSMALLAAYFYLPKVANGA